MPAMYRAVTLLVAATLSGQWINEPARGVPRTRDGKPNLTAPAPRMGGKPDMTGLWQTDMAAPGEVEKFVPGLGSSHGARRRRHDLQQVPVQRPGRLRAGRRQAES